jgi:hypothetical protein
MEKSTEGVYTDLQDKLKEKNFISTTVESTAELMLGNGTSANGTSSSNSTA